VIRFAETCEAIAATPATSAKVTRLAEYLVALDDVNLEAASRFFTGRPFAPSEQRKLATGGGTILAAARNVWHISDEELSTYYRAHGDLGAALAPFTQRAQRVALFTETLTPSALKSLLNQAADASGKSAGRKRQAICERILSACSADVETKYVVKVMIGDLRIGLKEGLVTEAIAGAFARDPSTVRRAVMASGDVGRVAVAARYNSLAEVGVAYGSAIGFMLASPLQYGSSYRELRDGEWIIESKFDGIRAQLHKFGDRTLLFSRTFAEISGSYPEVIEAARSVDASFILDGELVAQKGKQVLPFRYLQARLQRKVVSAELLQEVPVTYICFDILALNNDFLVDLPLTNRRRYMNDLGLATDNLRIADSRCFDRGEADSILHQLFEEARAIGHEGLVAKRSDSAYHPGKRGKWWLKIKRELSTLDVVVIAVEWGHGKRSQVLSDYTFAVRGEGGALLAIGKAYSGLTDAEIAELTPWFLEHQLPKSHQRKKGRSHEIPVEPKIVLEVAFDIIQESNLHESGFSLRFPRIVRIRDDKPPAEVDTIARVEEIYKEMLKREGLA
jgi:DNA ligase-1